MPIHCLCTEWRAAFGTITFLCLPFHGHWYVPSYLFPSLAANCRLSLPLASQECPRMGVLVL